MNCYKIKEVKPDGYVTLVTTDDFLEKELPLRSTKIMFECGNLPLINPEIIYNRFDTEFQKE
jgi:hypothetical protein